MFSSKQETDKRSLTSKASKVFAFFDTSESGWISVEDIGAVLRSIGFNPTEQEINEVQESLKDKTNNDEIEFQALHDIVNNFERQNDSYQDLLEAFKTLDSNETGYISATELKELLMNNGEPLSEEEANQMLSRAEVDRKGRITYINFAQMIAKEDL